MHALGICISNSRLRTITTDLANSIIRFYEDKGTVVPVQARIGIFTTSAFDNMDVNPKATTSRTSLHGSCRSILQFPTLDNHGIKMVRSAYLILY